MKFIEIIRGVETVSTVGDSEIHGIQYDSRKVKPGDCFLAIHGDTTDGNKYIDQAIAAGAKAVITDSSSETIRNGVAWAVVNNGRRAMSAVAMNFFGHPEMKLKLTGVTGTNGKTTTTFLIEAMMREAARGSALLGTIEYRLPGEVRESPHTTPESLDLLAFLAQAVEKKATEAVLEVSSHALAQERVWGIPFDVALFTNLTQDHLDYHQTMDAYFEAKKKLFTGCGCAAPRVSVLNTEDEWSQNLATFIKQEGGVVVSYGVHSGNVHTKDLSITPDGLHFELVTPQGTIRLHSELIGRVNVQNILAASTAALARGCTLDDVRRAVTKMTHVPGRFQRVNQGQPFTVVVDYAHTEDALRNLTRVGRDFVNREKSALRSNKPARVFTLFGCGGDRDKSKRPRMGMAAGVGSDLVILTSDNPRSEHPLAIIHDALQGLRESNAEYIVEPDRRRAIQLAIEFAHPGDIVLIAGKGHEKTQVIGEVIEPFDDVAVAQRALYTCGYTDDFSKALDFTATSGVFA